MGAVWVRSWVSVRSLPLMLLINMKICRLVSQSPFRVFLGSRAMSALCLIRVVILIREVLVREVFVKSVVIPVFHC